MFDKDSSILYERYMDVLFNEALLQPVSIPREELIGQMVEVHPVVSPSPHEEYYMRWSIKLLKGKGLVIGYAQTIHLKDCYSQIKHKLINNKIRSREEGKGQKTNIILLRGTVVDFDFPVSKINNRIRGFESVTYNPHKHDEYLYTNCLPDWWHTDERFWDVNQGPERVRKNPIRQQAMIDREQKFEDKCQVSKKVSDELSYFKCKEVVGKQHNVRGEDYMWVKEVFY